MYILKIQGAQVPPLAQRAGAHASRRNMLWFYGYKLIWNMLAEMLQVLLFSNPVMSAESLCWFFCRRCTTPISSHYTMSSIRHFLSWLLDSLIR